MSLWRGVVAGFLVVTLGVALAFVLLRDSHTAATPPTLASTPNSSSPTTTSAPIATLAVTTTQPPSVVTSTVASAPPVVIAMRQALAAWGQFAVTGRMRDLEDHFVIGGPQRRQLRAESADILEDPLGEPGYVVTTTNVFTVSVTPGDVVLRTEIEWAREGEETQFFVWDIQMQLFDGVWQLLTVEEVTGE